MAIDQDTGMTDKMIRFCHEYIVDLNGTQAAIRAGYSENSANEISSENLAKPRIKEYIDRLKKDRAERLGITADKVLAELSRLAFSNVQEIFTPTDGFKRVSELDEDTARAIQSVKVTKKPAGANGDGQMEYDDVVEYKMNDKKSSLDLLAKHLGIAAEQINVSGAIGVSTAEASDKAKLTIEKMLGVGSD